MRLAAALILSSAPGRKLDPDAIESAERLVRLGTMLEPQWLSADSLDGGEAWRARVSIEESQDVPEVRAHFRRALVDFPIDVNLVPDDRAFATKRLLAADMESTVIEQEMIDEAARDIGIWDEISRITAATMRGELPFETSLRERIRHFGGLKLARLEALMPRMTLMAGAERLFRGLKANGVRTAIITGGFSVFAEIIGQRLGVDHVIANRLEIEGGRLTGRLLEPVIGVKGKEDALKRLATETGLDLVDTAAVGDGANDLGMLGAAGLGVAFRAKPKVRDAMLALRTGAVIDHADLSAVLDLQGLDRA